MIVLRKSKREALAFDKRRANERWDDVMKDAQNGILDRTKIVNAMVLMNNVNERIMQMGYRDLL